MGILKSLIIAVILSSYVVAVVFAVDANTGNNVCDISKKDLFDGTQNPNGECVTTVMGEIPSKKQMVSTIITFPKNNDVLEENKAFTIVTKSINLKTGFFDDPVKQYY